MSAPTKEANKHARNSSCALTTIARDALIVISDVMERRLSQKYSQICGLMCING